MESPFGFTIIFRFHVQFQGWKPQSLLFSSMFLVASLRRKPVRASFRCYPKKNEHFWECLSCDKFGDRLHDAPQKTWLGLGEMSEKMLMVRKSYWTSSSGLLEVGFWKQNESIVWVRIFQTDSCCYCCCLGSSNWRRGGRTKELLFLKVWNLLKRNAEPLKISSKVAWLKYIFDLVIYATKNAVFEGGFLLAVSVSQNFRNS